PVRPRTSSTCAGRMRSADATRPQIASLARPPSGGAATRTLRRSPIGPAIASRDAPGTALMRMSTAVSPSAVAHWSITCSVRAFVDRFVTLRLLPAPRLLANHVLAAQHVVVVLREPVSLVADRLAEAQTGIVTTEADGFASSLHVD